jgi:hypothetical protein
MPESLLRLGLCDRVNRKAGTIATMDLTVQEKIGHQSRPQVAYTILRWPRQDSNLQRHQLGWLRAFAPAGTRRVDAAHFLFCDRGLMTGRLRSLIPERPGYRNHSIISEMSCQHTLQPSYRA